MNSNRTPEQQSALARLLGDSATVKAQQEERTPEAYTVRVLWEGEKLEDDVTFTDEQQHTAEAYFASTESKYLRLDPIEGGVTVQLFDADGTIIYERFVD